MDHFLGGKTHPITIIFKILLIFVLFLPFTVSSAPFPANHSSRVVHSPPVQKFPPKLVINQNKHKTGELLIKYKEGASDAQIERVNRRLGIPREKKIDGRSQRRNARRATRSRVDNWRKVTLRPGVDVEQVIEMYANDPNIEYVEPNYEVSIDIQPNDDRFSELWGMHNIGQTGGTPDADIDAPEAWDKFTGADSTIVAVIDTGVDYDHEDLTDNMWVNIDEIPDNGLDDDGNGYVDDIYGYDFFNQDSDPFDDHGHGTHCAGTIAGLGDNVTGVAGVNWRTRIMALKFLAAGGYGYTEDAIKAVRYAISMGANIMSNSWGGGGYSQILADAISDANDAGIVFVAAAGNNGTNNDAYAHYPSTYHFPNVISVAATDHNDELAAFSNYGIQTVHLSAPGVNILSTVPLGGCALCDASGYLSLSGTSMATPHVAGAAALLLGMQPELEPIDVINIIMDTADRNGNLSDKTISGARLNINSMISAVPSIHYLPLVYPKRRSVRSGGSTTFDIEVKSFGTFSGPVTLAVESPDSQNITISIEPNVVIPPAGGAVQATMVVSALVEAYDSEYDLVIRATDETGNVQAAKTRLVVDAAYMLPGDIGGYITKDIAIKENTDYHVTSDLIVSPGATLTIEQGANVTFDSNAKLRVEGGLVVSGTAENPVIFTSSNASPDPGSWYGLYIADSTTTIEVRHAVVEWSQHGVFVDGSDVIISDTTVRDFTTSGIAFHWGASGVVRNTVIQRAGWPGVGIQVYDSNNVILQDNDIQNVSTGLAFFGRVDTLVVGNNIQNNSTGISISSAESNVTIRDGNVISNNYTGISIGSNRAKPIINNNEIANNTQLNLRINHSGYLPDKYAEIDVRNNWWGTTDVNVISSKILDRSRSYPDYASALFTPYLDDVNGNPVTTNYLEGIIRTNKTIGPGVHVVAGTLRVVPGATLHIEAGAVLQFVATGSEETLIVDGSLLVEGAADNPVRITSNISTPAIADWYGIKLTESSVNNIIQHALIAFANTALYIESDDTIVDHVAIEKSSLGIHVNNASVTVSDSSLQDAGILMEYGASGLIENNAISLSSRKRSSRGIWLRNASPTIRDNRIDGFNDGIYTTNSAPSIEGNILENNKNGINVYAASHPIIRNGNKIINNAYGINIGNASNAVINDNSIFNNSAYNIYARARRNDGTIDATRNWWGTTDANEIALNIFDIKSSDAYTSYALVQFVPYLDAENGNLVSDPGIINGVIETDTTWSEGVYTLVNGLPIATGATLTIEPGAELHFVDDTGIVADGRLVIVGDENNPIRLVSTNANALGQDWTGIIIKSTSEDSIISHVIIDAADTAITINGNNTTVSNVTISKARTGIKVDGATVDIRNNTINTSSSSYRTGIRLDYGAGGVIKDNEIINSTLSSGLGIGVAYATPTLVEGNTVQNFGYGMLIDFSSNPTIVGNTLSNGTIGIDIRYRSSPTIIDGNDISGFYYGMDVYKSTSPTINGNNIYNNTYYNYRGRTDNYGVGVHNAINNWWGASDPVEVAEKIYDFNDYSNLVELQYEPFALLKIEPPTINPVPSLVTQEAMTIDGTALPNGIVRVYVNDQINTTITAGADGRYNAQVTIAEGFNKIYVVDFDGSVEGTPSDILTTTLDTQGPIIQLDSPINGGAINSTNIRFAGQLNEPATLSIDGTEVSLNPDLTFLHVYNVASEGEHIITLSVTDVAGNTTTYPVTLSVDITVPAAPNLAQLNVGNVDQGQTTIAGAAGSVEANAEITITNLRSGEIITVAADAVGSFNAAIAAQPADEIAIVMSDSAQNQSPVRILSVPGDSLPLELLIVNPQDNASINNNRVTVRGTYSAPPNTGISVNGVAAVLIGNEFIAHDVPLIPDSNTLEARLTTFDNQTLTQSITVTSTDAPIYAVEADPKSGLAPLDVTFTVSNETSNTITLLEVDVDGDQTADITATDLTAPLVHQYTQPGIYDATVTVTDNANNTVTQSIAITVDSASTNDARVYGTYYRMLNNLRNNNVNAALSGFVEGVRPRFEALFNEYGTDLPAVVDGLGSISQSYITSHFAELVLTRQEGGVLRAYYIYLMRDGQGIWRITEM